MTEDKAVEVLQQLTPALVLCSEPNLIPQPNLESGNCRDSFHPRLVPRPRQGPSDDSLRPPNAANRPRNAPRYLSSSPFSVTPGTSTLFRSHPGKAFSLELHQYVLRSGSKSDFHLKNFISATASYISPVSNPLDSLEDFRLSHEIFSKEGRKSTFYRLYHGQQQVQENGAILNCLSRLILVLLRHDLDCRKSMIDKSRLAQGRGRMTAVLEDLSQELSISKATLKDDNARSTLYCKLIEKCGPGDLATLGSNNHAWEKILSSGDVDFMVSFRRNHFPDVEKAARGLDFIIAKLMIDALVACGWEYAELARSGTCLLTQLRRFVDMERLARGEIRRVTGDNSHASPVDQEDRRASGKKRKRTSQMPRSRRHREYNSSELIPGTNSDIRASSSVSSENGPSESVADLGDTRATAESSFVYPLYTRRTIGDNMLSQTGAIPNQQSITAPSYFQSNYKIPQVTHLVETQQPSIVGYGRPDRTASQEPLTTNLTPSGPHADDSMGQDEDLCPRSMLNQPHIDGSHPPLIPTHVYNDIPEPPYIPGSSDFNAEESHGHLWYGYQPGLFDMNSENLFSPYEPGQNQLSIDT